MASFPTKPVGETSSSTSPVRGLIKVRTNLFGPNPPTSHVAVPDKELASSELEAGEESSTVEDLAAHSTEEGETSGLTAQANLWAADSSDEETAEIEQPEAADIQAGEESSREDCATHSNEEGETSGLTAQGNWWAADSSDEETTEIEQPTAKGNVWAADERDEETTEIEQPTAKGNVWAADERESLLSLPGCSSSAAPTLKIENIWKPEHEDFDYKENIGDGKITSSRKRKQSAPVSTSLFIEVDAVQATDMAFHPTSLEFVVAFPDCTTYYKIEEEDGEGKITSVYTSPLEVPHHIVKVAYRPNFMNVVAIAGAFLINARPILQDPGSTWNELFSEESLAMAVEEIYAFVGTSSGMFHAVEIDTWRIEFSLEVDQEPILSLEVKYNLVFGICRQLIFIIDVAKESILQMERTPWNLLCFTVHRDCIVLGTADGHIIVHNVSDLIPVELFSIDDRDAVTALASIGDTHIAVGFGSGTLKIYTICPVIEVKYIAKLAGPVLALSISFDRRWMLSNDHYSCKLFPLPDLPPPVEPPAVTLPTPEFPMPGIPMPYASDEGITVKQEPIDTDYSDYSCYDAVKTEPPDESYDNDYYY